MRLTHVFIIYNVMAFLTQPLTGWMADVCMKQALPLCLLSGRRLVWASGGLLAAAVLMSTVMEVTGLFTLPLFIVVALLLGAGNSLFHVWGGKVVAVATGNDMRALGVFVSTGAFGLAVAAVCCSLPLLYMLLAAIGMMMKNPQDPPPTNPQDPPDPQDPPPAPPCEGGEYIDLLSALSTAELSAPLPIGRGRGRVCWAGVWRVWMGLGLVCLLALILFVMLRSYVGGVFSSSMATDGSTLMVLLIGGTAMAGKMAGGWVAKWLGIAWGLTLMVAATGACLWLCDAGLAWQMCGLLAINLTMPVTLYMANAVLPAHEGLAFGLLAAALMPAYLF